MRCLDVAPLIGIPYRAGGQTPTEGFDCYGLIAWLYQQEGLWMPPGLSTYDAFVGHCLGSGTMPAFRLVVYPWQALDILVFRLPGTEIRHLGCVVEGSRFVHCGQVTNGVAVADLSRGPWRKLLRYGIRRMETRPCA